MPDKVNDKKAPAPKHETVKKPAKVKAERSVDIQPHHKVGLVELIMFLLLAGVVFIFVFGMQQMKREKAQELLLRQKFEQILPNFATVADSAKAYQARDPFAAWPLNIEEMNLPDLNTPEFTFSFMENGVVTATTTKEFGKEGIKVNYEIASDSYNIDDPDPKSKPIIKNDWLNQ